MKNQIFGMDDNFEGQNVAIEDLESERQTLFHILLDESGSMSGYESVMRKCLDLYKQALMDSKQQDEILIAITRFASDVNLGGYQLIGDMPNDYSTNGCTALYEAIVRASEHLINPNGDGYMDKLRNNGVNAKAIVIVFSDGQDNESRNMLSRAKQEVAYLNSKEVITAFVEFGSEAHGIADDLGFKNILKTDATESELRKIFSILSKSSISASKSAGNVSQDAFFV